MTIVGMGSGCVRRRQWRRVLVGPAPKQEESLPPDIDVEIDEKDGAPSLVEVEPEGQVPMRLGQSEGINASDEETGQLMTEIEDRKEEGNTEDPRAFGSVTNSHMEAAGRGVDSQLKNGQHGSSDESSSRLAVASAIDDDAVDNAKKEESCCLIM
jgi:hypothetical protein